MSEKLREFMVTHFGVETSVIILTVAYISIVAAILLIIAFVMGEI